MLDNRCKRGASGGTYALLVGLISVVALVAVSGSGESINALMTSTAGTMGNVVENSEAALPAPSTDTQPDAFDFADQPSVAPNSVIASNTVTITGISDPATVSISGDGSPEFSVDGDSFSATPRTISAGQSLQIRLTSNSSLSGTHTATVDVGGVTDSMSVTTSSAYSTFSFTTCATSGRNGPSQGDCDSAYGSGSLAGVTVSSGYQLWTVPYSGTFDIDMAGARGGFGSSSNPGNGARVQGRVALVAGQSILILVGQMGNNATYSGGGGGGTFVTSGTSYSTSTLIAAAGGGGGYGNSGGNGYGATNSTSGSSSTHDSASGSSGNGGSSSGSTGWGGAGSGFLTNGGSGGVYGGQSYAFRNGGQGGPASNSCGHAAEGGFGGGGGNGCWGGGGGGGYSGGGSGGGGGGTYTAGLTNVTATANQHSSHGYVTFTYYGP